MREHLKRIPLFHNLSEGECAEIERITYYKTFNKKSVVFMQDEERTSVFFIVKGVIRIYKIDDEGNEQVIAFLTDGEMFPHTGFFDQSPYPATAEVMDETTLLSIPITAFESVLEKFPQIAIKVMRVMGKKIRDLQQQMKHLISNDTTAMICAAILRLAKDHGKEVENTIVVELPITHQHLANMIGVARESVTRTMNQLKQDNVLTTDRKKIVILNVEGLKAKLNASMIG
ncbi:Crp/Fnr family transcriptional regulator [Longirhabdus pacifica]|uniref:Crp/Fnr family transcriptional regulator n=1 Tax=Longirhabdus pacifica TaxID=2305227 RepID=UPI001F0BA546|nr:Crp/Fnr family transcriptional regulator [Longirhabdus pacifica]